MSNSREIIRVTGKTVDIATISAVDQATSKLNILFTDGTELEAMVHARVTKVYDNHAPGSGRPTDPATS